MAHREAQNRPDKRGQRRRGVHGGGQAYSPEKWQWWHPENWRRWQTVAEWHHHPRPILAMTTDTKIVNLPQWLEPEAAAAALGISYRTLRDRAQRGEIARRRDGRCVLYRVAIVAPDTGVPLATASVRVAKVATVAPDTGTASELVSALVDAVDRAARAEARVDALTTEADRLQARIRELEADLHLTTTDLRAANARVERVMVHWQDALKARRSR